MSPILLATQRLSLLIGFILLVTKFVAYGLTSSNTILTDALESIVNVVAGGLGLWCLSIAALPKDENHPYGHGKVEFISAAVEGVLVLVAGILIVLKSGYSFYAPTPVQALDLGMALTAVAGAINFGLGVYVERQGKQAGSIVLQANGKHLQSDGYSTVGMLLGLGALWLTGWLWLDAVLAIIFGGVIVKAGIEVLQSSLAGIMDEVDYPLIEQIVEVLNQDRRPERIDIHNLRVIKYGTALHVDCHMTIPWYFNARQAHNEVDRLEELLASNTEKPIEFFVHLDPCMPFSCQICHLKDCPVRQLPWQEQVEWTVENISLNQKHFLASQEVDQLPDELDK